MAANQTSFKTGNPGGGRKAIPTEVREALDATTPKAIAYLARVLDDPQARTSDRIKAAETLLDRAIGKPTQAIDLAAEQPEVASLKIQFVSSKDGRIYDTAQAMQDGDQNGR